MIFVTVGTQGPFDRLVDVVDDWARRTARSDVFAQVGPTKNPPHHIRWVRSLPAAEFTENVERAQVVVSHAGMGTIITALEFGTPLIVMPRRAALQEQRNDHQVATARRFNELGRIGVAFDDHELAEHLKAIDKLGPTARQAVSSARQTLIETLCRFAGTGSPDGLQPEDEPRGGER